MRRSVKSGSFSFIAFLNMKLNYGEGAMNEDSVFFFALTLNLTLPSSKAKTVRFQKTHCLPKSETDRKNFCVIARRSVFECVALLNGNY